MSTSSAFRRQSSTQKVVARIRSAYRESPSYLAQSSVFSSLLWVPYSVLLIAVLQILIVLGLDADSNIDSFVVVLVISAFYALLSLSFSVFVGFSQVPARPILHATRAFLWFLAFPARAWFLCFTFIASLVIRFWWVFTLLCMLLVVVFIASDGFKTSWSSTALIVGIIVAACFVVVGGTRWGNQYGSGVTGGTPLGCVIIPVLFLTALVPMLIVVVAILGALFLPGVASWLVVSGEMVLSTGEQGSWVSLEIDNGLAASFIVLTTALVFVVLPAGFNYRKTPSLFARMIDAILWY